MKEKISIIVPIYNTQNYLRRCINSIIEQTYSNLEIILLNDGSTDKSLEICEEYKNKDERIIVINKKNTGVSDTRNEGIRIATGKYIGFVDSDDYIDKDMFEVLHKNMIKYDCDISMCGHNGKQACDDDIVIMEKDETFKELLKYNGPQGFLWNKLYKKSIIENNNLQLDKKIYICEDFLFNCYYLSKINKSVFTKQGLYNYEKRIESACNEDFNYKWISLLDAYDKMNELYKIRNKQTYNYFRAEYILTNINVKSKMYLARVKDEKIEQRCNNVIKSYIKETLKSKDVPFKKRLKLFCYYYFHPIINILKGLKKKMK